MNQAEYGQGTLIERKMDAFDPARRKFFSTLVGKIVTFTDEMKGIPQMKLSDLRVLSDEVIEKMIPVLISDGSYKTERNRLMRHNKKTGSYVVMRILTEEEMFVLGSFDGLRTISQIASDYAGKYKLDKETASTKVKSLFFDLA